MSIDEIRKNKPEGATHYMDDEKGFDYVKIDEDRFMCVWFGRFNCWLELGYVSLNDRFKPL